MGHMGNEGIGVMGYSGYGAQWVMGHMGKGAQGYGVQWVWVQGYGPHGQWGAGAMGTGVWGILGHMWASLLMCPIPPVSPLPIGLIVYTPCTPCPLWAIAQWRQGDGAHGQ